MEISKFIQQALKDGSLDKVSKGIEQLVVMMINAIGMIEHTQLELTQRIETIEEDLNVMKEFLLSKPVPLPGTTQPIQRPPSSTESQPPSVPSPPPTEEPTTPQIAPPIMTDITQAPQTKQNLVAESPITGPSEEDIREFRRKLLKPTPKHEKPKPQPISIRATLIQEMKEYFGSAMTKVEKEKKDTA